MSGRFGSGAYSKLMNRMAVKYTPMEYAKGTFTLLSYIFLIYFLNQSQSHKSNNTYLSTV